MAVIEVTGKLVVFAGNGKMMRIYDGKKTGGYGFYSPYEFRSLMRIYYAIQSGR